MNETYARRVQGSYLRSPRDHVGLFQTVLAIASEIGLDAALSLLEACVAEKRLAWFDQIQASLVFTNDPLRDGFRVFYERYLGLSCPQDGEIIEASASRLVMRWWNPCPTLEACMKLGLDTREVCRKAYQGPVQDLLTRVNPNLRFQRNYQAIRPYTPYCEEILTVVGTQG